MSDLPLSGLHREVWEFLADQFSGQEKAARRETIICRFNLVHRRELDDRVFREIVANLVKDYKKAICTHPQKGYYVARTEQEKNAALNYLDSVIAEIAERRRSLADADPLDKQGRLF